jgi:IclR family pca regulon transcriptional regulator
LAKADRIEGAVRALAVLESFGTERQRLNATLAAARAGMTRAAARRHLLTLAHLGYLDTDGREFWLSPKVLRLSGSYLASAHLPRVVQPTLNRLAAQSGDSFSVVVLDGDQVVIVARSVAVDNRASVLAHGLHLGARLPAHATSTGQMLLASLTQSAFSHWMKGRALPRLTGCTCTSAKAFSALIGEVRQQDWCVAHEAHELGVHALAVPLRNMQGTTVAALNVVSTATRLRPAAVQRDWLPLLSDAARELRALL